MFAALSGWIYRRRRAVLTAGAVFLVAAGLFGGGVLDHLQGGGFAVYDAESTQVSQALHRDLGQAEGTLVVLFTAPDGTAVDHPAYQQAVAATLARLQGQPGVGAITTFYTTGRAQFVSHDRRSTYALVGLAGDDNAQQATMRRIRPLLTSDRLLVRLTGYPAWLQDNNAQIKQDLETAEKLTFPVVALLLILIFGTLVAAALPLIVGATALLGAFLILRLAAAATDISIFAVNIVTVLSLGLAIDYSLFIVSRFREELARTQGDVPASLTRTLETAGRTVLFSGLTVVICLLSLLVFPQMFFQSMGLGGAAAALVAMIAALTVLPALLAILGPRVDSLSVGVLLRRAGRRPPGPRDTHTATGKGGFWDQTSRFVLRHPVGVLVGTLVLLLVLGLPFLRVRLAYPDARTLPPGTESRVASEILLRDFPRNETRPIQVIVYTPEPVLAARSLGALSDYARRLQALPGVRRVDSLVTLFPGLEPAHYQLFYTQNPLGLEVARSFARGQATLITVLYDTDPYATASQELVRRLRTLPPPPGARVLVGGDPAVQVDFLSSLAQHGPVALTLIVGVIFVLLFLLLGSLVVPLKAILMNILSLSVCFGALVWIFQDGHLADRLGVTPLGTIDSQMPVLIFAVAFGLSMDYEVFLLSRIREQYDRTGDPSGAVAAGMRMTGGIITGAALILVVVFGSFLTAGVLFIKQMAVGLSLAILVDATVVRLLLVPALLRLLGHYNWWLPAPLSALYQRLGLAEPIAHHAAASQAVPQVGSEPVDAAT